MCPIVIKYTLGYKFVCIIDADVIESILQASKKMSLIIFSCQWLAAIYNIAFLQWMQNVVKWNEHFTESAIFSLRQCCIYKVGNPIVEFSGFYIEVID